MENISKALRVAELPDSFATYNGRFTSKLSTILVEKKIHDFTKRVKGQPTITSTFEFRPTSSFITGYAFNLLSDYIHDFDYDVVDDSTLFRAHAVSTATQGPFAGQTYWNGFKKVLLERGRITHLSNPFKNTTFTGYPEPTGGLNPSMTILREEYVKTTSGLSTRPSKSYPSYTMNDILAKTGLTFDELCEKLATVFIVETDLSPDQYVLSVGAEVEITDNTYTGNVYYNGINTKDFKPSGLITSYGKTYPGHVTRWILYNGAINIESYGATWMLQESSSAVNDIKVVEGDEFSWNSETRTLTYNKNLSADLHFQYEELPAQGKNQSDLVMIKLA